MARCDICGKGPQSGHNVSHSNRRTKRAWIPNTKKTNILLKGKWRSANVCTRCLRTIGKASAAA